MSRVKSSAALTAAAANAKLREEHKIASAGKPTDRKGKRLGKEPRKRYLYHSSFGLPPVNVPCSGLALAFFGGFAELGLAEESLLATNSPRSFKPARLVAVIGAAEPKIKETSYGTKYTKYTPDFEAGTPSSHTGPVSATTSAALKTKIIAVVTAVESKIGAHGYVSYLPESPGFFFPAGVIPSETV